MKIMLSTAAFALAIATTPALAEPPEDPGLSGRANAFGSPGFATAADASGKGLGLAADVFGDNGIGNGADPDSVGLAGDHDPGNVGGGPDTSR